MSLNSIKGEPKVADLLNPPLKTDFMHYLQSLRECVYASNKLRPLGRAPPPNVPHCARNPWWTFGRMSEKGDTVRELLFPFPSCGSAGILGDSSDNTIGAFHRSRKQQSDSMRTAGLKCDSEKSGHKMKELMNWCGDNPILNLISIDVHNFRERHQPCVGKCLCPAKIKGSLPDSYQFGQNIDPCCYVMNQALTDKYDEPIKIPPKGSRQEEALLHQLMNKLKVENHHNFDDLVSAFKEYDQNNCGKIAAADIKAMCEKFGILTSEALVKRLLTYCDALDHDGLISYQEFIHFLNWKDKLPEKYDPSVKVEKYHNEWSEGIKCVPENVSDSYKSVTALSFASNLSSASQRTAGVPTIRVDRKVPEIRKVMDKTNYGEINDISSLLHPNIFLDHGVYEEDLFAPRDKAEMKLIFGESDIKMDDDIFETLWNQSSRDDKVSIEAFRKSLNEYIWANHEYNPVTSKHT